MNVILVLGVADGGYKVFIYLQKNQIIFSIRV